MFIQLKQKYFGQEAGARVEVDEPVAHALIQQGVAEAVQGDPLGPLVARGMETLLGNLTRAVDDAVGAALKQFADAQSRSRRHAVPAIFGNENHGDPKKTFGAFLLAVAQRDHKTLEALGSRFTDWGTGQKVALNEQTGTQGGYTVPTVFLPNLLTLAAEQSLVESRATRIPMAGPLVEVPALDVTTAPTSGETAFFGGVQANWEEEASTIAEEEPTFRQIRLQARELKGYTLASNSLLADNAIGLEALLLQLFAGAIAWHKDRAFLRGSGTNQPLGVLNAGCLISVTRSAASAVALADLAGMLGRFLPGWMPANTV